MKILFTSLGILLISFIGNSQTTLIPDIKFEEALISEGYESGPADGSIATWKINKIQLLYISNYGITDLTGIEDFTELRDLHCSINQLTSLDLTKNSALEVLYCYNNQLTSLDVSQNSSLTHLICYDNQLTNLDLTKNTALEVLDCWENELINLNVNNNNNSLISSFTSANNPSLTCIQVDNETDANNGLAPYDLWSKDDITSYSENCQAFLSIDDEILNNNLDLYPNPVYSTLSIESKLPLEKVEIYSILGKKMKEVNSDFSSISTEKFSKGIYMIRIYSKKGTTIRKLIKQ